MDNIAAYREVGTYRGAAVMCGTTHKTVKCIIERQHAGGKAPNREPRAHNYDSCAELVTEKVAATHGKISAKRLLTLARAATASTRPATRTDTTSSSDRTGHCRRATPYVDARIAQTSNPKHVEQLKVLRADMVGEVSEDVDALLATISPLRQQYRTHSQPLPGRHRRDVALADRLGASPGDRDDRG